jgi:hypothetical protein
MEENKEDNNNERKPEPSEMRKAFKAAALAQGAIWSTVISIAAFAFSTTDPNNGWMAWAGGFFALGAIGNGYHLYKMMTKDNDNQDNSFDNNNPKP